MELLNVAGVLEEAGDGDSWTQKILSVCWLFHHSLQLHIY